VSPDSKWIAFTEGDELKLWQYSQEKLGVVAADGSSAPRILTTALDRSVSSPLFSPDGHPLKYWWRTTATNIQRRSMWPPDRLHRIIGDAGTATGINAYVGHTALVWTTDSQPGEVYALENGSLRRLTHHNDEVVASLKLADYAGSNREIERRHRSARPDHPASGAQAGTKYPMLLFIHGGPNGQDDPRIQSAPAALCRARLRGAQRELPRRLRARKCVSEGDRRRLGPSRGG